MITLLIDAPVRKKTRSIGGDRRAEFQGSHAETVPSAVELASIARDGNRLSAYSVTLPTGSSRAGERSFHGGAT